MSGLVGDAVPDIVVGTEHDDDGGTDRGAAWVLFMDPAGTTTAQQKISDTTGGFNELLSEGDSYGSAMATIGDLNGDGVTDVAVGAQGDNENRGAVWILFMNSNGSVNWHQKIGDGAGAFDGVLDPLDQFGASVTALGDLDGDGTEDIAVGAPLDDDGGTPPNANRGAVWVLFLNPDGTVKTTHKIADNVGGFESPLADGDMFGYSVAFLGDIDSDGLLYELAVGAINNDDGGTSRGAVYILSIFDNGACDSAQKISSLSGGFAGPLDDNDFFGSALAPIGDLDGDGVVDLAAGAIGDDDGGVPPNADRGAVWLLFLDADRTVKVASKISDTAGYFAGVLDDNDAFGYSLASLDDLDGDGVGELAVGAPNSAGPFDEAERGAVWILFLDGPSGGAVKTYAKIADGSGGFSGPLADFDWLGTSVTSLGDIDSNGAPDIMAGAQGSDDGG
ncbi:MAG: integrin alpha, partial [bacterium]